MKASDNVEKIIEIKPNGILSETLQGQLFALCHLMHEDRTSKYLSEALNVSTARMAVILNSLEKQGKVKRYKTKEDKRLTYIHLTDKGYEDIMEAKKYIENKVLYAIEILGEEEFSRFMKDIYKLCCCKEKENA